MGVLNQVACALRVEVPSFYARRFIEHFPFRNNDRVSKLSCEHGSQHDYIILIDRHLPHDDQIEYTITFPAKYKITGAKALIFTISFEDKFAQELPEFLERVQEQKVDGG